MSAELFRRALTEEDAKMFRKWIVDLEDVISNREATIRCLEAENLTLKARIRDLISQLGVPVAGHYTPVDAPLEFTETPGEYVPISKATEAQMRLRKAMLQIDARTIADWEATEQALRRAAEGLPPSEVDNSYTE